MSWNVYILSKLQDLNDHIWAWKKMIAHVLALGVRVHISTSSAEFWNNGIIMQHQSSQTRLNHVLPMLCLQNLWPSSASMFLLSQATSESLNINLRPTPCRTTYPTPRQTIRCWTSPLSPRNLPRNILQQATFHKANQCELRSSMMIHLLILSSSGRFTESKKWKTRWFGFAKGECNNYI